MSDDLTIKLEKLRVDFEKNQGHPFNHFFCPILFRDEEVELCKAHIVNEAFPNTARAWTVQRKDIDGFYGRNFEADFISLGYRLEKLTPIDAIASPVLSRKLKPKILINDQPVNYFVSRQNNQSNFTRIDIENNSSTTNLVLKLHPKEMEAAINQNWEIEINSDLRLAALVSLIKSAHLTLFEILGYLYAYSSGGYFIGKQVLGDFFLQNQERSNAEIIENAYSFFKEFHNLVRPVEAFTPDLKGTITDKLLFACKSNHSYWAFIVFIRTSNKLHSVIVPILDKPESAVKFADFLKSTKETHLAGSFCRFDKSKQQWEIDKTVHNLLWTKSNF